MQDEDRPRALADDEVALPMAGLAAAFNGLRTIMDRSSILDGVEYPPEGSAFRCSSLEMVVFARPSAWAMAPVDRPAARKMPIWSLSSSERCE